MFLLEDLLEANLVFTAISEVVLVEDAITDGEREFSESHFPWIVSETNAAGTADSEIRLSP